MVGLRIILGTLAMSSLSSAWYTHSELQKRNAMLYLFGCIPSGCGGLLAYGLMQMDGQAGIDDWQWIFTGSHLPGKSPQFWKLLNETEASFVIAEIERDRAVATVGPFFLVQYLAHGKDSKL
ncbi:hypothetical protein N7471_012530 [Penicillium samsonianum]|uniref:uncharacterized protein n=1 Tax=Penicillium samsonianum TaxID=1882272 RepID=UPI002548EC02|nr:uncharacterized protein N7471_012530 [Penicillium samsonianum]KAJ6125213.1 hypothetical protein N7471_012530 [Penicillium samsonianum]